MTDYVIMPKQDYKEACDAIRSKTGKSDLIKSGDMASEIGGIAGGGSTGGGRVELVEGAAYKTKEPDVGGVYIVVPEEMAAEVGWPAGVYTLQEIYGQIMEGLQVIVHDVDKLPDEMLGYDYTNRVWHFYRINSTGIVYDSNNGTPAAAQSLGEMMFGTAEADKGWVDSVNCIEPADENAGVYSVRDGLVDKYYTFTDGEFVPVGNGNMYVVAPECGAITIEKFFAMQGLDVVTQTYIVEELPEAMKAIDISQTPYVATIYIVKSTGIGYVSEDGTSETAMTVAEFIFDADLDKGYTDDIGSIDTADEANAGVYCVDYTNSIEVDDANTYTYGDSVYLHDVDGWHMFVVPTPIKLQEKTTTKNGEVTADEGYDGLAKVTVAVPTEGGVGMTVAATSYTCRHTAASTSLKSITTSVQINP